MRTILPLALLILSTNAAFAHDGAESLKFQTLENAAQFRLPPASEAGEVLWDSGASRPAVSGFQAVLIQGVLKGLRDSQVQFQAAIQRGPGWSEWSQGEIVECYPNGRFWARIYVQGGAGDVVRVRALSRAAAGGGTLEIYGVETKPEEDGGDAQAPSPSSDLQTRGDLLKNAASLPPNVLPREAWGAKPIKAPHRFEPMRALRLTVHHTEGAQPMDRENAIHELQAIQSFHQNGRGWNDIAYHYLIDGTGQIWQGRPEGVVGSHVLARNDGSIGIVLMGSFHPPKNQHPTPAQIASLVSILRYLSVEHQIPVNHIYGHREQEPGHATDCPGNILFAMLPDIRRQVAAGAPVSFSGATHAAQPLVIDTPAMRRLMQEVPR